MFSIFDKKKVFVGVDIGSDYLRFTEISFGKKYDEIISFAEQKDLDITSRSQMVTKLSYIRRMTKSNDVFIALPENIFTFELVSISNDLHKKEIEENLQKALLEKGKYNHTDKILDYRFLESLGDNQIYKVCFGEKGMVKMFQEIFEMVDFNILGFESRSHSLINSCLKKYEKDRMVLASLEKDYLDCIIYNPFQEDNYFLTNQSPSFLGKKVFELNLEYHSMGEDRIKRIYTTGELSNQESKKQIEASSRIPVSEADVFENLNFPKNHIPSIRKDDSKLYGVSIGLCLKGVLD